MMKLLDKFLKKLNVNRNTFFTFILTLMSFYICIDRIVEMLLMIFTGVSTSYWGPFTYTLALACPVFAFLFSGSSSFAKSKGDKLTLFYLFMIGLYIITISMFTQWLNFGLWELFLFVPNYTNIVTEFPSMVKHAFCAISLFIPLTTVYPFIVNQILMNIDDNQDKIKSIWDYKGISLSNSNSKHTAYMCDVSFLYDYNTGKNVVYAEKCRYRSLLVCGSSGTGKTSKIFEPMIAQDIEKKFFFNEVSKELGFTALKTGIATLSYPYSNEYLNDNFNLNMLTPTFGKETLFKTFMQKMLLSSSPYIYKNVGLTYVSPDDESIYNMIAVCNNYNIKYNIIDPLNLAESKGINPFVYDDPTKIALTISSTLNGLKQMSTFNYPEDVLIQILENLSILLKLIYPKLHDGAMPNMEDLLKLLNDFSLIQNMCNVLKSDNELSEKYLMQIKYIENNFYPNSIGLEEMKRFTFYIASRIENLLRSSKIKEILCSRTNNIDFDNALSNGEFIFVCTRRGDSGKFSSTAFGLFFLISMQNAIYRRPGTENTRIPHYLYIDEFPDYVSSDTEAMFTTYRKYCVGTTISTQSISMLNSSSSDKAPGEQFNRTILSNCSSKIFTGGAAPIDELQWWQKEIGQWKQWGFSTSFDGAKGKMDSKLGNPKYDYKDKINAGDMQFFTDDKCAYKIIGDNGGPRNSVGIINFMSAKYKSKHSGKKYDFSKYTSNNGISSSDDSISKNNKFDLKNINFKNENNEYDPIQSNSSEFLLDNDDAIIVNFKNKKAN